jgi:hypothetical protein
MRRSLWWLLPALLPAALFLIWHVLGSTAPGGAAGALPRPELVIAAGWRLLVSGELLRHGWVSLERALGGLLLGGSVGLGLGLLNDYWRVAERLTDTAVQMLRNIPHLALLPLTILWFGLGEGLQGREHDWPRQLSGGERQRLALARALVSRPSLLLLDEPLGALDALTRLDMQLLIERIWQEEGFTAVLVTHDVHEAVALGDEVVSIEAGQVALRLAVDLPRPRDRQSPAFNQIVAQVLAHLLDPQPGRRLETEQRPSGGCRKPIALSLSVIIDYRPI